jgi:hypothetical protein
MRAAVAGAPRVDAVRPVKRSSDGVLLVDAEVDAL